MTQPQTSDSVAAAAAPPSSTGGNGNVSSILARGLARDSEKSTAPIISVVIRSALSDGGASDAKARCSDDQVGLS